MASYIASSVNKKLAYFKILTVILPLFWANEKALWQTKISF